MVASDHALDRPGATAGARKTPALSVGLFHQRWSKGAAQLPMSAVAAPGARVVVHRIVRTGEVVGSIRRIQSNCSVVPARAPLGWSWSPVMAPAQSTP